MTGWYSAVGMFRRLVSSWVRVATDFKMSSGRSSGHLILPLSFLGERYPEVCGHLMQ